MVTTNPVTLSKALKHYTVSPRLYNRNILKFYKVCTLSSWPGLHEAARHRVEHEVTV